MSFIAREFACRPAGIIGSLILVLAPVLGHANDLKVPNQYPTIQSAINAAAPGDRVLVAKGIYQGSGNVDLDCNGKAITIEGAGYLSTVIDCQGSNHGFIFHSAEQGSTEIRSLSIKNSHAQNGGAMVIIGANPSIVHCGFQDNTSDYGGAISIASGSPGIIACDFERNRATYGGGAVFSNQGSPTISGCTFSGNDTKAYGGSLAMLNGSLFVVSCIFNDGIADQGGGGFYADGGDVAFVNCSFSGNVSNINAGAIDLDDGATASLTNCTLGANLSHKGPGALRLGTGSNATVTNSIMWSDGSQEYSGPANIRFSCIAGGASGEGNTADDPHLIDAIGHDLHIQVGSSCIDKGDTSAVVINEDQDGRSRTIGTSTDMGAYEYPITHPTPVISVSADTFSVPHDGNPNTDLANVTVKGTGYDWLLGTLSYQWTVDDSVVATTPVANLQLEPGDREFKLTVRDSSGNISTDKVVVHVLPEPNSAPVANAGNDLNLTSTGGTVHVILHGHGYDADGDTLSYTWSNGAATPDNEMDLAPGIYHFKLTVTDPYGASGSAYVNVNVADAAPPVVTLKGDSNMTQEVFDTWVDPGASAEDAVDGKNLAITVYGSVDVDKLGTYTLTYVAKDSSGNTGSATRAVKVADTIPPVITISGLQNMTLECGQGYTEPGASATDNYDGTDPVTISGTVPSAKGTYAVTYTSVDSSGNTATVVRTVTVADTKAPVIALNGSSPMTIQCGSGYTEPGATATDACDGSNIPVQITGTVLSKVGTYIITYMATDSSGNKATLTRTVNVIDTLAPVITLNGSSPMTVDCVKGYTEPGATAVDACDGSVTVVISGTVPSIHGTYTVTYTATDSQGNKATATRTVTVVSKTPPSANNFNSTPTSIKADNKMHSINLHYGFNSHCASFTWDVECTCNGTPAAGDIVKIDNNNFTVKGVAGRTYTFTLTATDADGNVGVFTDTVPCN